MGFIRDLEKLISALLTLRVWGLGEMGSVLEKYLFLLGSQRGYAFAPEGMGVAPRTVQKFSTRLVRLYKQGANSSRLGQYADRWCRWSRAGVAT